MKNLNGVLFQVESIKANLNSQFNNLNGEIEKFKLRWDSLKPKEEALEGGPEGILKGIRLDGFSVIFLLLSYCSLIEADDSPWWQLN